MSEDDHSKIERLRPVRSPVEEENAELRRELERIRSELRHAEDRFHAMADTAFEITIVHVGGTIVDANEATLEISGYSKEEVLGKKVFEFYTPETQRMLKEKLRSPDPGPYEAELLRKDGKIITVQVRGRDIIWNGKPARVASAQDINEQVKAKKALEQERMWLKAILDTLPVGVLLADARAAIFEANDLAREIMGEVEVQGRRGFRGWWANSGIEVASSDWGFIRAAVEKESVTGQLIDIQRSDGSRGTILESAAPLRDPAGKIAGSVAIVQDITAQRKLEREAVEAKERAELFIDLLIHDINNMNAVASGYLQLIDHKGELGDRSMLRKAQGAMDEIDRLIDTVRKIKTLDRPGARHRLLDLGQVIGEVVVDRINEPGNTASIRYESKERRMVLASDLLREVFANIIDNAVKHAPRPVTIDVRLGDHFHEGKEYHLVSIEDDGPGIPDEMKPRLFSRLQRGNTRAKGSGLGLYLVRSLVEDLDGIVWMEDRVPGDHTRGSRFVVLLPVAHLSDASIDQE
ncbi:PAS domain-containing sensor histidine kinase [Methanomassiliicoccus luminyensis]|uniref:PAS domain-containing sensor histidine kinase n=1 Tax=Methanomassiliicoccus luminyensis TaxID=1080712 RepID=UPI0011C8A19E|nr:PAS domain-containing sensor histidine kinase [Methanomassiliicoccus luminyensis]